jgi:hypothetical protein
MSLPTYDEEREKGIEKRKGERNRRRRKGGKRGEKRT